MMTSVIWLRYLCCALLLSGTTLGTKLNQRSEAGVPRGNPVTNVIPELVELEPADTGTQIAREDPVSTPAADADDRGTLTRRYRVTAYCDRGLTAAGVLSGLGQCAAPANIPFGSIIYIPQLNRSFVVTDRTHRRFRTNTVDLFFATEAECRQFGRRYLDCQIRIPDRPARYGSHALVSAARAFANDID